MTEQGCQGMQFAIADALVPHDDIQRVLQVIRCKVCNVHGAKTVQSKLSRLCLQDACGKHTDVLLEADDEICHSSLRALLM